MRGGGGQNSQKNGYVVSGCPLNKNHIVANMTWHLNTVCVQLVISKKSHNLFNVGEKKTGSASFKIQRVNGNIIRSWRHCWVVPLHYGFLVGMVYQWSYCLPSERVLQKVSGILFTQTPVSQKHSGQFRFFGDQKSTEHLVEGPFINYVDMILRIFDPPPFPPL